MPRAPFLLLFLSVILLIPLPGESRSTGKSRECEGRWIHIRELPARFNAELLATCDSFPILTRSFCSSLSDHGLGPRTHNRSRSWYRTDSHLGLEPLFHRRMLEYPCLTPDPDLASAVFLPYYSYLDALRFLYSPDHFNFSAAHGRDLHHFLYSYASGIWSSSWRAPPGTSPRTPPPTPRLAAPPFSSFPSFVTSSCSPSSLAPGLGKGRARGERGEEGGEVESWEDYGRGGRERSRWRGGREGRRSGSGRRGGRSRGGREGEAGRRGAKRGARLAGECR